MSRKPAFCDGCADRSVRRCLVEGTSWPLLAYSKSSKRRVVCMHPGCRRRLGKLLWTSLRWPDSIGVRLRENRDELIQTVPRPDVGDAWGTIERVHVDGKVRALRPLGHHGLSCIHRLHEPARPQPVTPKLIVFAEGPWLDRGEGRESRRSFPSRFRIHSWPPQKGSRDAVRAFSPVQVPVHLRSFAVRALCLNLRFPKSTCHASGRALQGDGGKSAHLQ